MDSKWQIRHTSILLVLVSLLNPAMTQLVTTGPRQCGTTCTYTEWAQDADCKNRHLMSVPTECNDVVTFDLRRNNITTLPAGVFEGFLSLRYLDIEMMFLESIEPGTFVNNDNLLHIYVQLNQLRQIRNATFTGAPNLLQLFLNRNEIREIEGRAFDGIPHLETLFLSDNDIVDIPYDLFHQLTKLRYLYIENNHMSVIHEDTFKGLKHLRHLSLAGNDLAHIPLGVFDDLTSLRALKLSNNHISSISTLPTFPKLNQLDLYDNKLRTVINLTNILVLRRRRSSGVSKFTQLFLAKNPLYCDCDMEPLRVWMQGHYDQIHGHHRANATCDSPEELRNTKLCTRNVSFCHITMQSSPKFITTTPSDPPVVHSEPALMPITIAIVCVSSVVLVVLGVWTLYVKISSKKVTYKRQRSTESCGSNSSDKMMITQNPMYK